MYGRGESNRRGSMPAAAAGGLCLAAAALVLAAAALLDGQGAAGAATATPARANAARDKGYLSPLAVAPSPDGRTLYVAEATGRRVAVVDLAAGKVTRKIALPAEPGGLAVSPDGARLYVTAAAADGAVHVVDPRAAKVLASLPAGHTPVAVAVGKDGSKLYVCNRFDNDVSVLDVAAGKEIRRVPVLREPVAVAATPDGKYVVVANHLPRGRADGEYAAAGVSVIDAATDRVIATVKLHNGSIGVRGLCVSPDGRYAYATHVLAHYQLPTTQVERGWICTNAVAVIDVPAGRLVNTVLVDSVDAGAANPWGVACSSDGKYLCVAHAGTDELSVIDREGLHRRLEAVAAGVRVTDVSASADDVPNDLAFVEPVRRRIALPGKGPRGLAVAGGRAWAAEYFSDTLAVVDLPPRARPDVRSIALGRARPMTAARKGEMLFNDAALCLQQWQSCASCHPDARTDGLNWDLLNDGIGNPKNAKSMLLAHRTPPTMISGVRASAEVAVRAGIRFIQFASRPEAEAAAIDEYLKSLEPVPSPYLVKGELSVAARRGRRLFESAGCGSCHSGELGTDLKSYDVGTGPDQLGIRELDTPTLVEVWRTAPYLLDGRAATILQVLTKFNPADRHGTTSKLTRQQLADLAEYVLSR